MVRCRFRKGALLFWKLISAMACKVFFWEMFKANDKAYSIISRVGLWLNLNFWNKLIPDLELNFLNAVVNPWWSLIKGYDFYSKWCARKSIQMERWYVLVYVLNLVLKIPSIAHPYFVMTWVEASFPIESHARGTFIIIPDSWQI